MPGRCDWHAEAHSADRPVQQDWSIVYGGTKALTSPSAKNSVDRASTTCSIWPTSPGSRSCPSAPCDCGPAAHAALHRPGGLDAAAAAVLGVDPANALRKLTGAIGRAYKLAA